MNVRMIPVRRWQTGEVLVCLVINYLEHLIIAFPVRTQIHAGVRSAHHSRTLERRRPVGQQHSVHRVEGGRPHAS